MHSTRTPPFNPKNMQAILGNSPIGYACLQVKYDCQGKPDVFIIVEANHAFESITGFPLKRILGKHVEDVFVFSKSLLDTLKQSCANILQNGGHAMHPFRLSSRSLHFQLCLFSPYKDHIVAQLMELSNQDLPLDDYRALIDTANGIMMEIDEEYLVKRVFAFNEKSLSFSVDSFYNRPITRVMPNALCHRLVQALDLAKFTDQRQVVEYVEENTSDPRFYKMEIIPSHERNNQKRLLVIVSDMTEQKLKLAKAQFSDMLSQKKSLYQEIHHRTKNNLQILSGLMYLQSLYTEDPFAKTLLLDSQNRIKAMAFIHEQLFVSNDQTSMDLGIYIEKITTHMLDGYQDQTADITFCLDLHDISLPMDQAVPCGLLVHELCSNSFQHAFSGKKSGKISISTHIDQENIRLVVSDDGIGFPSEHTLRQKDTFGLLLIDRLIEQLEGSKQICTNEGMTYHIRFPLKKDERSSRSKCQTHES